jgi:hypothetical protein
MSAFGGKADITSSVGQDRKLDPGSSRLVWRREWDSNPRYGFPYTRFPSVRLKPLGHPSGMENRKGNIAAGFRVTTRRVVRCGAVTEPFANVLYVTAR